MTEPAYVYVTYILSTLERVLAVLTKEYWVWHRNASPDWRPGSRWEHQDYDDARQVDIVGEVLEHDRPKRLVISWRAPGGSETSRMTFTVEPSLDGAVRLMGSRTRISCRVRTWIAGSGRAGRWCCRA